MHGVRDFFPGRDLVLVVDTRHVGVAGAAGRDEGGFGDEEGAGYGGPLAVVFCGEAGVDVSVVGAVAGQGCQYDAVGEEDGAEVDGGEKGGRHGGRLWCWLVVVIGRGAR